jgi:hypothetical protein
MTDQDTSAIIRATIEKYFPEFLRTFRPAGTDPQETPIYVQQVGGASTILLL